MSKTLFYFLGISKAVFHKLEWRGKKCSWDTFKSGNYVLIDYGDKNESAMYAAIDAKKGADQQVKAYINKNVLKENDMINVFSVLDMEESFQRFVSKYYMIGGFLVIILAFIGIMNFFNTTATSVLSRKKELALLEVVGMMPILAGIAYMIPKYQFEKMSQESIVERIRKE